MYKIQTILSFICIILDLIILILSFIRPNQMSILSFRLAIINLIILWAVLIFTHLFK